MSHRDGELDNPEIYWESTSPFGVPADELRTLIDWGSSPPPELPLDTPLQLSNEMTEAEWNAYSRSRSEDARLSPGRALALWLIIRVDGSQPGENIEYHSQFPMLVPKCGRGEICLVSSSTSQVREFLAGHDNAEVFLVYRATLHGELSWRGLLEYLAQSGSLEKEKEIAS